jgi:uncharacterized protein (DUF983 family)
VDLGQARRILGRGLALRCPRCGAGRVFRGWFQIHVRCPQCQLVFEREPGYFVGAIYLNYGTTVLVVMPGYFVLDAWLAPPLWAQLALWGTFAGLFPIWFFRYSKSLWLAIDYLVDPTDARRE